MLAAKLLNVGFGNMVAVARVIAIVDPGSAPMKRLKDEAKQAGKLVDATNGRRTRSIIVTDSDHVVLSAIQTETIAQRFETDALSDRPGRGKRAE
jgi:extracellular matrix regulatory protein A